MAGEIKVLDAKNLTRAVRIIKASGTVVIKIRGNAQDAAPTISNLDGVAADITGAAREEGIFAFPGVGEGSWRVNLAPNLELAEVRIEN